MYQDILLLCEKDKGNQQLEKFLSALGYEIKLCEPTNSQILDTFIVLKPCIVVIYLEKTDISILQTLRHIQDTHPSPIIVFTDACETQLVGDAVNAGASGFIIDGIEEHRIPAIIEAAIARFNKCQVIKKQLNDSKLKLKERRDIDKAKGILMQSKNVSEDEAYTLLRSMAMNKNLRIGELARSVISAAELLK